MRAILVSVDYTDLLSITLPYNRHHFEDVMVVTAPSNEVAVRPITDSCNAKLFVTDLFYGGGAIFNKWKALEAALDAYGRHGWLCLMDADILWPHVIGEWRRHSTHLYVPRRRIFADVTQPIPQECYWRSFPLPMPNEEFAGYSQIFNADDPLLAGNPWHQVDWVHAGGADSFFHQKWHPSRKLRPPFEVLHLGHPGQNWCGRATQFTNGELPEEAEKRRLTMLEFLHSRRGRGEARYKKERI